MGALKILSKISFGCRYLVCRNALVLCVFSAVLCITCSSIFAQSFPVTVRVQFSTQELPYFEQLVREQPWAFQAQISLNDPNRPTYDVSLRLEISGQGISVRTRPDYQGPILTLSMGEPLLLDGSDLIEYLSPTNLEFLGTDRADFLSTSRLPEGTYTLCIEAYDVNLPNAPPVSNRGCAIGMVNLYDAPLLLTPLEDVIAADPQNLVFQWLPQHIGGFPVVYDLVLYTWEDGWTADQAISNGEAAYIEGIQGLQYTYTLADPFLPTDQKYIAYVRVRDESGMRTFKNDGISPVHTFFLRSTCQVGLACDDGDDCTVSDAIDMDCICRGIPGNDENNNGIPDVCEAGSIFSGLVAPVALPARDISDQKFTARWMPVPGAQHYEIEVSNDQLFSFRHSLNLPTTITDTNVVVTPLDLENYQYYRVRAVSNTSSDGISSTGSEVPVFTYSDFSAAIAVSQEGTCQPREEEELACDNVVNSYNSQGRLIKDLKVGDQIYAADYGVTLSRLEGSNPFSGQGYIRAPYAPQLRLNVTFRNITIDENCRLIDGYLETTGAGLQILGDQIGDIVDQINDQIDNFDRELTEIEDVLDDVEQILNESEGVNDYFGGGLDLGDVRTSLENEYPYLPDSTIAKVEEAVKCLERQVEEGHGADCQEQMTEALKELGIALEEQFKSESQVTFHVEESYKGGFDGITYAADSYAFLFKQIKIAGKDYNIPYRSMVMGEEGNVLAEIGEYSREDIRFENGKGEEIPAQLLPDGKVRINLTDQRQGTLSIYARETNEGGKYAGKLTFLHYPKKKIELRIVTVNQVVAYPYEISDLEARLNKIYDPALVEINVIQENALILDGFSGTLTDDPTKLLENYTTEMDRLNKSIGQIEGAHYLFLVERHATPSVQGYWPRGRDYGYVFTENHRSADDLERTIAHELGHGALKLAHIYEDADLVIGSTDNLMDYRSGTELWGYQWERIFNPVYEIFELGEDEEGQQVLAYDAQNSNINTWISWTYGQTDLVSFSTPAGQAFSLPPELNGKPVLFGIKLKDGGRAYPSGTVSRLRIFQAEKDEYETYTGWFKNQLNYVFAGYARREMNARLGKYQPDGEWLESSEGGNAAWLSARDGDDCTVEVLSGSEIHLSPHISESFIPPDLTLEGFDQVIDAQKLGGVACDMDDKVFVYNYSSTSLDTAKLNALYGGQNQIIDPVAGRRLGSKFRFFFTDASTTAEIIEELGLQLDRFDEEVIWVHDLGDRYELRTHFGAISSLDSFYAEQTFDIQDFIDVMANNADGLAGSIYELADFVAGGIRQLKIPAYVWDTNDENYDPTYVKVYEYITLPLVPYRAGIQEVVSAVWEEELSSVEYEFALLCGLWNGSVEMVAAIPDLVKVVGFLNGEKRQEFQQLWDQLRNYEKIDPLTGEVKTGVFHALKDGIAAEFDDPSSPRFYHNVAEYGVGIVLIFINPGQATSTVGRVIHSFIRSLKAIDAIQDKLIPLGVVMRSVKGGVSTVVQASGEILFTLQNDLFRARLLIEGTIKNIDYHFNQQQLQAALVPQEGGVLALKHGEDLHPFAGLSTRKAIATALGITEEQLEAFYRIGLKEIEISDLLKNYQGTDIDAARILSYVDDYVREGKDVFLRDMAGNRGFGEWVLGDGGNYSTYRALNDANKKSKLDPKVLASFHRLNENVKDLVLKFSDNPPNSTLGRFLFDCENPDFLDFVNEVSNENIVKSFVSHKDGVDLSAISDELADKLIDDVDDLPGEVGDLARKWNKRSSDISTNNTRFAKARNFEQNNSQKIRENKNPPCGAWGGNVGLYHLDQLHVKAKGSDKRVVLDDALVDKELYTDPITLQSYQKAIYHDSKLTKNAPWSTNQDNEIISKFRENHSLKYIEFEVRNSDEYFALRPNSPIGKGSKVRIYREDIYKSVSGADGENITDVINMDLVNFSN